MNKRIASRVLGALGLVLVLSSLMTTFFGGRFVAAEDGEPVEAIAARVVRPPVVR